MVSENGLRGRDNVIKKTENVENQDKDFQILDGKTELMSIPQVFFLLLLSIL